MDICWAKSSQRGSPACAVREGAASGKFPTAVGEPLVEHRVGGRSSQGEGFPFFGQGLGAKVGCKLPCPLAAACTPTTCSVTATWPGCRSG